MGVVYDKSAQVLESSLSMNRQHLNHAMVTQNGSNHTDHLYFFERDKEGRSILEYRFICPQRPKASLRKSIFKKSECRLIVNSGMPSIKQISWWHHKKKLYTPLIKPLVADVTSAGKNEAYHGIAVMLLFRAYIYIYIYIYMSDCPYISTAWCKQDVTSGR